MKRASALVPVVASEGRSIDGSPALYESLVESLTEFALFAVSPDGTIVSWNQGAHHTFGYSKAEALGHSFAMIFTEADRLCGAPAGELAKARSGKQTDYDRWHTRMDGSQFWGTNTVQPIRDGTGTIVGFTKLVRDITETYLARMALSDSEQRLRLLFESVPDFAIFAVSLDGTISSWNIGAQSTFGYEKDEIVGRALSILYTADDIAAGIPVAELLYATQHESSSEERWLVRKDRTRILSSGKLSQLKRGPDGALRGFIKVSHDITERKRASEELRRRAVNDQLTKLPNRATFYEHVYRAIASMKRRAVNRFAVLFIDLDHFKSVNDTYGHIIADSLLEETARRLERCVRSGDVVARLGGDEFAILLNGIADVATVTEAGDRIGIEMARPVTIEERMVTVTASVGIALGSAQYDKPEDVLRDADTAMYVAKTRGRARSVLFESSMNVDNREHLDLDADLRLALGRDELRLAFQPIVDVRSGSVTGFEALVRWDHPRYGLLEPARFIAKAERTDLIVAIDRWAFMTACRQLADWRHHLPAAVSIRMSVNFSRKHFSRDDLPDFLVKTLEQFALRAPDVQLEITETGTLERSERTSALLEHICASGIGLIVDDFGMGYASLELLAHLPIKALKIDRSFVSDITTRSGRELVRSIVSLAHNLELTVIAEGVENDEQLTILKRLGCDAAQGFLFSPPLSAGDARAFLAASRPEHPTGAD